MKTAMQELKFFISDGLDNLDESIKVSEIWEKIDEYIETEKQQIIDARVDGTSKSLKMKPENVNRYYSALYYEQTFETNKETLK